MRPWQIGGAITAALTLAFTPLLMGASAKPQTVTYEDTTAYVILGQDPAHLNANLSGLNDYYFYVDEAIGLWNSDPSSAETWGGTAVTLQLAPSCPDVSDYCIYATEGSFTALGDSDNQAGFGSYYAAQILGAGVGERGYLTINTDGSYTEEQRITFVNHEFGHALGIPYDSNNDPTDLMSDVAVVTVQGATYTDFQEIGQRAK